MLAGTIRDFDPSIYATVMCALTTILGIKQEPDESAMAFVNRAREAIRQFRLVCPASLGDLPEPLIAILVALRGRPEFVDGLKVANSARQHSAAL